MSQIIVWWKECQRCLDGTISNGFEKCASMHDFGLILPTNPCATEVCDSSLPTFLAVQQRWVMWSQSCHISLIKCMKLKFAVYTYKL